MWERVGEDDEDEVKSEATIWEKVDDDSDDRADASVAGRCDRSVEEKLPATSPAAPVPGAAAAPGGCTLTLSAQGPGKPLSLHSKEGRAARTALQALSIRELRERLAACGAPADSTAERGMLAARLLEVQGVEAVLSSMGMQNGISMEPLHEPAVDKVDSFRDANGTLLQKAARHGVDYSKFSRIDYEKEYGLGSDDECESTSTKAHLPNLRGTLFEGLDPASFLTGDMTEDERRAAFMKAMKELAEKGGLKAPPPPPAPECNPMAGCTPSCDFEVGPESWLEPDVAWSGPWPDAGEPFSEVRTAEEWSEAPGASMTSSAGANANADSGEDVQHTLQCGDDDEPKLLEPEDKEVLDMPMESFSEVNQVWMPDWREESASEDVPNVVIGEEDDPSALARRRVEDKYSTERQKVDERARVLEAVDVDGWGMEKSQLDLVEEADEDLTELKILLKCCEREDNRKRLLQAIHEFEVKLRVKRTWAWFPLTRWEWTGYEYEKPVVIVDFKLPGAGKLPAEDIHCDFGVDWFDLKVWNVIWPEDPEVAYHHRVKKTRLMRDIVPSQSSVKADGDHIYVHLQKVCEPRHGYCAWPDLSAGKGRKPFKYNEDAPDGGLMDFFEGEYEKHEGYDGFRRDIGKAMEKIHRCEPIRGIDDSPIEEP